MNFYDIHAHLADERIRPEMADILAECRRRGVRGILASAARVTEWPVIAAAAEWPPVYGALGLHPFFLGEWSADLPRRLRSDLCAHPRLRAVGEIGLDFYHGRKNEALQLDVFTAQLGIASELNLPVVVHNRKSWSEFFAVLRDTGVPAAGGVCHHFSGSVEIARRVLDLGLDISFCGPVTYPNARRLREAARFVPLERILTETDAPDLPPEPYRSSGRSYPYHVVEVVRALAEIKGLSEEAVAAQVEANFRRVLGITQ